MSISMSILGLANTAAAATTMCAICHLAFSAPVRIECGHIFCRACWTAHTQMAPPAQFQFSVPHTSSSSAVTTAVVHRPPRIDSPGISISCPLCRRQVSVQHLAAISLQSGEERLTECGYKGCVWNGPQDKQLEHHLACQHRMDYCPCRCGQLVTREKRDVHVRLLRSVTESPSATPQTTNTGGGVSDWVDDPWWKNDMIDSSSAAATVAEMERFTSCWLPVEVQRGRAIWVRVQPSTTAAAAAAAAALATKDENRIRCFQTFDLFSESLSSLDDAKNQSAVYWNIDTIASRLVSVAQLLDNWRLRASRLTTSPHTSAQLTDAWNRKRQEIACSRALAWTRLKRHAAVIASGHATTFSAACCLYPTLVM